MFFSSDEKVCFQDGYGVVQVLKTPSLATVRVKLYLLKYFMFPNDNGRHVLGLEWQLSNGGRLFQFSVNQTCLTIT